MSGDQDMLAELTAQFEIRDALYRFCRGVDRGDRDAMLSAFHPDATDSHGPGGPAAVADVLLDRFDRTPGIGQHHITNVLAEVSDEAAAVESYFIIFNAQGSDRGGEHDLVGGRYLDRFEKRDGAWRIARRDIVVDVARSALSGDSILASLPFLVGGRHEQDPSAAMFDHGRARPGTAQGKGVSTS
jgi:ketosteroid isomerase-like protein